MSPEEIKAFAQGLMSGQSVWYVLMPVVAAGAAYIGAYCAERGKNRATKEDIEEITKAVETAKEGFNQRLEDFKAHHQLRMVAAERRLQAHQEAFTMGTKLWASISLDDLQWRAVHEEARVWYERNVLFLGTNTRRAFIETLNGCEEFRSEKGRSNQEPSWDHETATPEQERLRAIWDNKVMAVFQFVAAEVELPPLASPEVKPPPKVG